MHFLGMDLKCLWWKDMKKVAKEEEKRQLICRLRGDPGPRYKRRVWDMGLCLFQNHPSWGQHSFPPSTSLIVSIHSPLYSFTHPHTQTFDSSNTNPGSVSWLMLPVLEHAQVGLGAPQSQAAFQLLQLANPHAVCDVTHWDLLGQKVLDASCVC